jgi:hypothetical protein
MPTQLFERSRKGETALLIQPHAGGKPDEGVVEEFADLARSAGATVAHLLHAGQRVVEDHEVRVGLATLRGVLVDLAATREVRRIRS